MPCLPLNIPELSPIKHLMDVLEMDSDPRRPYIPTYQILNDVPLMCFSILVSAEICTGLVDFCLKIKGAFQNIKHVVAAWGMLPNG